MGLWTYAPPLWTFVPYETGERGGSVVECRTPEREVRGSRPTSAVLCPWARHFTPRKYWLITQEAMAPSRHDWKIVDWDVKPQHNQPTNPYENWHVRTFAPPKELHGWTFAPSFFLLKIPMKTFFLAKVAFIKTPFYLVVAARGLLLP